MPFGDFATTDLKSFLQVHSDPSALWAFLHVPKTAGSSFGSELAIHAAPYRNVYVDYEDRQVPYDELLRLAVGRFIVETKQVKYHSLSGHLPYPLIDRIAKATPNTRTVTILRDPVARVISDYRYARTPQHPPYQDFIKQFPTIHDYIETAESQNKMFRFLAPANQEGDFDSIYREIQKNVTFIGLLEMYAMSFNILFRLFGAGDLMPVEHKRKTEETGDNRVDISPELIDKIRRLNERDVQLFTRVRTSLVSQRDAWLELRQQELAGQPQR